MPQAILGLNNVQLCGEVQGGMYPLSRTMNSVSYVGQIRMLEPYSSNYRDFDASSIDELYHRLAEPEKIPVAQTHGASLGPEAPSYSTLYSPRI